MEYRRNKMSKDRTAKNYCSVCGCHIRKNKETHEQGENA
jgi:hypothetical protein